MYCNLLLNNNAVITTGWIAVLQPEVFIDFNLEQYSFEIKTNSMLGSNDEVYLMFCNSEEETVGALHIYFHSTPQYRIGFCNLGKSNFPSSYCPTFCNRQGMESNVN